MPATSRPLPDWDELPKVGSAEALTVASIFQRGKKGTWWIKYYVAGEQVYHSLQTTNARVALKIKRRIEGEEVKGELLAP